MPDSRKTCVGQSSAGESKACAHGKTQRAPILFGSVWGGSEADAALEAAISVASARLTNAVDHDDRIDAWRELVDLHGQRSAQQVRRMEISQGLRTWAP